MHGIGTFLEGGNLPKGVWIVASIQEDSYGKYYKLLGVSESNQLKCLSMYPTGNNGITDEGVLGNRKSGEEPRVLKGWLEFVEESPRGTGYWV